MSGAQPSTPCRAFSLHPFKKPESSAHQHLYKRSGFLKAHLSHSSVTRIAFARLKRTYSTKIPYRTSLRQQPFASTHIKLYHYTPSFSVFQVFFYRRYVELFCYFKPFVVYNNQKSGVFYLNKAFSEVFFAYFLRFSQNPLVFFETRGDFSSFLSNYWIKLKLPSSFFSNFAPYASQRRRKSSRYAVSFTSLGRPISLFLPVIAATTG